MPSRKWKSKFICLVFFATVLLLGLWFGIDYWHRSNPVRQKVWELIDPDGPASSMYIFGAPRNVVVVNGVLVNQPASKTPDITPIDPYQSIRDYINEHGSEVYAYLNEFAMHRESKWKTLYRTKYPGLPPWLKSRLKPPSRPELISAHAFELIGRLGPTAARACAESVINGVSHPDPITRGTAVRSFWYVLPDSEVALNKFLVEVKRENEELLGKWNRSEILHWKWSQNFPQRLQITNGIDHVYFQKEVILALDHMGADASTAIPIVIGKLKQIDITKGHGLRMPAEGIEPFRREAVNWLTKFAENHSEVSRFLKSYIYDRNPDIRAQAGRVMIELARRTALPDHVILKLLQEGDLNAWKVKMRAIGNMAEQAEGLLPGIIRFTSEDDIKSWYEDLELPYKQPLSLAHLLNMKLTACVAVSRIDSAMAVEHLPFLVEAIGLHSDPVLFLKNATHLSKQIIPLVEPYLDSPFDKKQIIASDILLHHDAKHVEAIATLNRHIDSGSWDLKERAADVFLKHGPDFLVSNETFVSQMKTGNFFEKIASASILAKASGNDEDLLMLLEQGLLSEDPSEVSKAIRVIQDMENKPEQFIPHIQNALISKNSSAFSLLLEYGPEHLPPLGSE